MQIIHNLSIDLIRKNIIPPVYAMQGDSNTRQILLELLENGESWAVPADVTAAVAFRKADGTRGLYDTLPDGTKAVTIDGNTVTAVLAPQVLSCAGEVSAAVVFHDPKLNQLATFLFAIRVAANPAAGQALSNDYYAYSTMGEVSEAVEAALAALEDSKRDFLTKVEEVLAAVHGAATEDAPAIVCEATGETITVKDASDRLLKGLTICGKTTQVTTTGKNLLPYPYRFDTLNQDGVTVTANADGTITLNGTATAASWVDIAKTFTLPAGTYTIRLLPDSWQQEDGYMIWNGLGGLYSAISRTFKEATACEMGLVLVKGRTYNNVILKPQVEIGNTSTEYEPYTGGKASPSPEYPQELESVGESGSIGVTVAGKNLFNDLAWFKQYGGTEQSDGSWFNVYANTTCFTNTARKSGSMYLTVIAKATANDSVKMYLQAFYTDGSRDNSITILDTNGFKTVTAQTNPEKTVDYIKWTYGDGGDWYVKGVMISFVDNEYEPYKGQTLTAATPGGLHGIGDVADEIDFARGVRIQNTRKKVFNGTENWNAQASGDTHTAFWTDISGAGYARNTQKNLCSHFSYDFNAGMAAATGFRADAHYIMLSVPNTIASTSAQMKAFALAQYEAGTPVTAAYQLATPIETPLTAEELASFAALHSNKPNTTVFNDGGAEMKLSYVADTKTYIDNKFAAISAALLNA